VRAMYPPNGLFLYARYLFLDANFGEFPKGEVRRIPLPQASVNKGGDAAQR
jgi:hypothetical protein